MKSAVFSGSTAPHVADVVVQWFQTLLRLIPKAAVIIVEYHLPAVCQDSVHTWADYDPGDAAGMRRQPDTAPNLT